MSNTNPERINPDPKSSEVDHGELLAQTGGHPGDGIIDVLRRLYPTKPRHHQSKEPKPKMDPVSFIRQFRDVTNFEELDNDLVVTEDPVGFKRIVEGEDVTYLDSLKKARMRGKNEAVSYGLGRLGKHNFVGIFFNWEFMGASVGDVATEKFIRAMDLARTAKGGLPVVILYCSGGQRQQEAAAALWGMDKVVHVINQFKNQTDKPIVGAIIADTFGGVTASSLPQTDLIAAQTGANAGFAGPRLIRAYTGEEPAEDSQTVENIYLTNKTVQVLFQDQKELLEMLDIVFAAAYQDKLGKSKGRHHELNGFNFDGKGFVTPLMSKKYPKQEEPRSRFPTFAKPPTTPDRIYEQYEVLISDPRRPDFIYMLQNAFDTYVPFFTGRLIHNEEKGETKLEYPAIAYALAAIEDPRLAKTLWVMAIGNQPSYLRLADGTIMKDHASPNAWDYRNQVRMMRWTERMRRPLVSFIDTPGAGPTLKDELAAQYASMSNAYSAKDEYRWLTMTYVLGLLGSGGGGGTTFWDHRVMSSGAQIYVAIPPSAAEIVYKNPTKEDVMRTAITMRPDANFLLSTGQIDRIIKEPNEGAGNNPFEIALAVREDIIETYIQLGELKPEELAIRRDLRIRGTKPIPMGHLNGGEAIDHKSLIRRFLRR